jgi:hypothetical protein
MPWGRLDDGLYDHPKLEELAKDPVDVARVVESLDAEDLVRLAGLGLWTRAISYCNRYLTDGALSRRQMEKLGGSADLADCLVNVSLLDRTPTGFAVHDFLLFNDSRNTVLARRQKDADRKAAWRAKKDADKRPAGTKRGTPRTKAANVTPVVPASVPGVVPPSVTPVVPASSHARIPTQTHTHTRPDLVNESTPQPPASGGRRTRARDLGPMRSPTRYNDLLESDDVDGVELFDPKAVTP